MALHDRIFKTGRVATVTLATSATLDRDNMRTVATVNVAGGEKKEIVPRLIDRQPSKTSLEGSEVRKVPASTPAPCQGCHRFEVVEIQGEDVPGCLYQITDGEWMEGWKRLPRDMKKCIIH